MFRWIKCRALRTIDVRGFLYLITFLALFGSTGFAETSVVQDLRPDTRDVFERFSGSVVKIQIIENGSGAKSVIGSGFFVSSAGHVVTNYHVISKLIYYPDRYHAELIDNDGKSRTIEILAVDVINDLAIVHADKGADSFFRFESVNIRQGARLYSLGYPHDIGISIVEGTYNGLLDHAHYKKIHFTGSINSGMSGGPTITASGKVVGINVSTAGNQVSFLIPSDIALKLLSKAIDPKGDAPGNHLESIRLQLLAHQEDYFSDSLMAEGESVKLGAYSLPSSPAPFFECWADASRRDKHPYEVVSHYCSTNDAIFISSNRQAEIIEFRHQLITTDELNPFRFFELYTSYFNSQFGQVRSSEEEVTRFKCSADNVDHDGLILKTVFCIREYRKLDGLYDAVLKAATLGSTDTGLETTIVLSGVSFDKAVRLTRSYLEAISWSE